MTTSDNQSPRARWEVVKSSLARGKPARWPEPDEETKRESPEVAHRRMWTQALEEVKKFERLKPHQCALVLLTLGYRFTRALAIVGGVIARGKPLSHVPMYPDGWSTPIEAHGAAFSTPTGVCLDPVNTSPTEAFFQAFTTATNLLTPRKTGPLFFGCQWILDGGPDRLLISWPRRDEVLLFEEDLIKDSTVRIRKHGRFKTCDWLQRDYGFTVHEANEFMAIPLSTFKEFGRVDQETERGLLLARCEDYYHRMKKNTFDPTLERDAMKLHAQIAGLTRGVDKPRDDANMDLVEVIAQAIKPVVPVPNRALPNHPRKEEVRPLPPQVKQETTTELQDTDDPVGLGL